MVLQEQDSLIHTRQRPTLAATTRTVIVTLLALVILCHTPACTSPSSTATLDSNFDPETTPTMVTRPVTTLISDSGITRYRITAPEWYVFDEASDPRWTFPRGMNMEKFDNLFRQDATVTCDSAIYYSERQLWRLDGYVHIRNQAGQEFLTNQLYWDQRQKKIYSDSFIHILRDDKVIEGYGFQSDEQMNHYTIRQVQGIFPVSQFRGGTANSSSTDTLASARPGRTDTTDKFHSPPPLPYRPATNLRTANQPQ